MTRRKARVRSGISGSWRIRMQSPSKPTAFLVRTPLGRPLAKYRHIKETNPTVRESSVLVCVYAYAGVVCRILGPRCHLSSTHQPRTGRLRITRHRSTARKSWWTNTKRHEMKCSLRAHCAAALRSSTPPHTHDLHTHPPNLETNSLFFYTTTTDGT